jgi:ribosome-interacting GTPase 1
VDQLIDVIEGNRKYIPCLYVLNKCDTITLEELELLSQIPSYVPVCAGKEWGFDDLLERMWQYLDMKRMSPHHTCMRTCTHTRTHCMCAAGSQAVGKGL